MFRFSVVITVFNKQDYIAKTIQSVLAQTVKDFEIIIVNDGSTDHSLEVIKNFSSPKIKIIDQHNTGASAARNRGIAEATGKFIALLDGDDLWKPTYLQEIEKLQHSFPNAKIFATAVEIGSASGLYASSYSFKNPEQKNHLLLDYFTSSYQNTLLTSSSSVIHKDIFDKTGFFDESIKSGEDTDMWIRIGLQYPIAFSIKTEVRYNFIADSLENTTRSFKNKINFDKFSEDEKTNPALKKFIDLNRYSFAIKAKLWQDKAAYKRFRESINPHNLNRRQRFLFSLNGNTLRALIKIKGFLDILGLRLSAFGS